MGQNPSRRHTPLNPVQPQAQGLAPKVPVPSPPAPAAQDKWVQDAACGPPPAYHRRRQTPDTSPRSLRILYP